MSSNINTTAAKKEELSSFHSKGRKNPPNWKEYLPKATGVKKAKDLLNLFAKAFASMRIYPAENPTVEGLNNSFSEKMLEFLDEQGELKLIVQEFSFSFKEETVFQDEQKKASLPFLLFKDGMRELAFYRGLDKKELQGFLKVLKENADLPPDDSDIVNSLWMKDFPHIRHFAIDEFLESETGEEAEETSFNIDKEELTQGRIKLTSQDKKEFRKRNIALGLDKKDTSEAEEDNEIILEDIPLPFQMSSLNEKDTPEIESMLAEHRSMPPLTEMINLLFEILYLEDRIDAFSSILNVLNQFYKEAVYKSLFLLASLILHRLQELADLFSDNSVKRKELLEKTLKHIKSGSSMAYLKKLFINGQIDDFDSFFQYLKRLGPSAIPLVADIWEETKDPSTRLKASNFLYETGKKNILSLLNIAKGYRASLAKEVIEILGKIGDVKALPFLKKFIGHRNKDVRLSVVRALAEIDDVSINPILIEFLSDRDGEVRTNAAMSLKFCKDQATISYLIQIVEKRDFRERLKLEKKALLEYLVKTQSQEVSGLLRSILKKWSFFNKSKQNETRLCAIPALEKMASHEALNILEEGTKIRNKTIRVACSLALRKVTQEFKSNKILTGEQRA